MATTYQLDPTGRLSVRSETDGVVHRGLIDPGVNTAGGWVPADLTGQPQELQNAAAQLWTPDVVAAFKATFPYKAPPPAPTDQDILNEALGAKGSVVRAIGLVMFAEINKLRVKNGDAAYTLAQFKAALVAQMR